MSNPSNIEPYKKLVRRTSRAFYGDIGVNESRFRNPKDNQEVSFAEVILNTLTRYEWVKERDLEKALRVRVGHLQRTLLFLKKEKLVKCEQKGEPVNFVRRLHAGATADAHHDGREGDGKTTPIYSTLVFHTYWCLDYGQIYNVARYKLSCLRKKLKDELDSKNRMQEYSCPNCNERYTALNASRLFSVDGENDLSDNCHGQFVVESDKLVARAVGHADNNVNCCGKLEEMLQKMEEHLMPLAKQLNRVKELAVPDFGTLEAREVKTETVFIDQGKIGPVSSLIEHQRNLMQRITNSSNKKPKMDITSEPSNNKESSQIGPVSSLIERQRNLMQRNINSSSKKPKMDFTSEPSNSEKTSQDNHLRLPCHAAGLEVQWGQNTKKQQDHPSNVGQPTCSNGQQLDVWKKLLYKAHCRRFVTSGPPSGYGTMSQGNHSRLPYYAAAGLEVQQVQDSKKQQDPPSNVHILPGQATSLRLADYRINLLTRYFMRNNGKNSQGYAAGLEGQQEQDSKKQQDIILGAPTTLDCQVGMKRKHEGVNNFREVATPSGVTEEYCIQTGDDNNDGWELVEQDLILQFCSTL